MQLIDVYTRHRSRIFLLMRYGVAGASGAIIQVASLYVWVTLLGLRNTYLLGLILGFILALVVAFALQKYWVFRDSESGTIPHQLMYYSIVAVSGLVLNALLLAGARFLFQSLEVDFFSGWYLVAQVVIIVIVSIFNFVLNYIITFSRAREQRLWER